MSDNDQTERVDDPQMFKSLDAHANEKLTHDSKSEVIQAIPSSYMRGAIYLFIIVIFFLLGIAYFSKVHVIVPLQGRIAPEGENLSVAAQSAGIITEIFVREGVRVDVGDPIVELAQVSMSADLTALQNKLKLETEKLGSLEEAIEIVETVYSDPARIENQPMSQFMNAGPALGFINQLKTAAQDLTKAKSDMTLDMERHRQTIQNQIAVAEETLRQQQNSLAVSRKGLEARREMLEIKKQEVLQLEKLEAQRIVPRSQVVTAQNSAMSSEQQLNSELKSIGETRVRISELRGKVVELRSQLEKSESELKTALSKAQAQYEQALATVGNSLTTMREGLQTLKASLVDLRNSLAIKKGEAARLIVRAPRAGEVTDLAFNTPGQSVGRGTTVAVVVPDDVRTIVIATLPNKDVANVKEGTPARIKVDAYPFRQFGTVPATVFKIFPKPDKPEFVVHLALEKNTIRVEGTDRVLEPGLTVTADLLTKKQRILTLLMKKSN